MIKKLLCATDGSHASEKAVGFAVNFAKQHGAELTFLSVDTVTDERLKKTYFWDTEILEAADEQSHRELHAAELMARAAGLKGFRLVAGHGTNIAAAIIDYAEKNGCDHIVTGSTGRTGVTRMLLGSVANDVVAKAHCPVTVVR